MDFVRRFWNYFLSYNTVKFVSVQNKKVGFLNRLVQLAVLAYVIGYVIIGNKGYQRFSDIQSVVTFKVKGVVFTNFTDKDFNSTLDISSKMYNRVWDFTDLVIPPTDDTAFFIATNVIITPNQELGKCAECPSVEGAVCNATHHCQKGEPFLLGHGVATGNCVTYDNKTKVNTCEIFAWCPLEKDVLPLNNTLKRALLNDTGKFTVLIKNFISFPTLNITRGNVVNSERADYLKKCRYDPVTDPLCPVFVLKDIVENSGHDYNEMAIQGGVVAIVIHWECNLDFSVDDCLPEYSFARIDNPNAVLSPGWNVRYANYFDNNERTSYKLNGIDFFIVVTGRGGHFSVLPLFLNIGLGMALMAVASFVSDLTVLYVITNREWYRSDKYSRSKYENFLDEETHIVSS